MTHALLSPSSAYRWMQCPGSVSLCRLFPDESSEYAKEGTLAHAYAAHILDPNQPKPDEAIPSENLTFVNDYVFARSNFRSRSQRLRAKPTQKGQSTAPPLSAIRSKSSI